MPIGTGSDEGCTSKGGAFLFLFFISPDRFDRISSKRDAIHGHRNAVPRMLESFGCSKASDARKVRLKFRKQSAVHR